jgi:hypothetical protein
VLELAVQQGLVQPLELVQQLEQGLVRPQEQELVLGQGLVLPVQVQVLPLQVELLLLVQPWAAQQERLAPQSQLQGRALVLPERAQPADTWTLSSLPNKTRSSDQCCFSFCGARAAQYKCQPTHF